MRLRVTTPYGAYCYGYVAAIAEAVSLRPFEGYWACPPVGVSQRQLRDIVLRFLEANPQVRHVNARGLVAEALTRAFPCR